VSFISIISNQRFGFSIPRIAGRRFDALLAVAVAVTLVCARAIEAHGLRHAGWLGYTLSALAALAVAGRRRWPLGVFACTLALAVIAIALAPPTGAISLPVVIAVYTLAQAEGRRRSANLALIAGAALALARGLLQYRGWSDARTALDPALALAALFLGWAVSSNRAYIAEIEARAAEAERTRAEEARRQVDAERLRIARELHDVLAHGIATISLQAGVAAHVLDEHPARAAEALRAIKAISRDALRELRGILGVLREAEETEPREPTAGLNQLEQLVAAAGHAGVPTRVAISGRRRALPPTVDLAAYRIVQEALTNVLRHAGAASAVIAISYADDAMTLSVCDDGRGAPARSPDLSASPTSARRHGILGMRERAQALGGELEAGPDVNGGFRVRARLPISAGS
jgi:signal transduction histidine kinase